MIRLGSFVSRKSLRANFSGVAEKFNQIIRSDNRTLTRSAGNYRYINGELILINNLVLHYRDNIEH